MAEEELLVELECPVCTHYMHSPIQQCIAGHSLCKDCFEKVKICPICNQAKGSTRSFALEKLAEKLRFPCKNQSEGCSVTATGIKIKDHEKICSFSAVQCPLQGMHNCTWCGSKDLLLIHAEELHPQGAVELESLQMTFPYGDNEPLNLPLIIKAHGELFGFIIKRDKTTNLVAFVMKYYGPASNAKKYSFNLIFTFNEDSNKTNTTFEYIVPVYSSVIEPLDFQEIDFGRHMLLHDEMLKRCSTGNLLNFKLAIDKIM